MASDVHVDLDPNLDAEVAKLVVAGEDPLAIAERIVSAAQSIAPVGDSGDYKAGIKAQRTKGGARVLASDYKSAWIEFGVPSQGQAAKFVLRRAVDAVGLTFRKKGG